MNKQRPFLVHDHVTYTLQLNGKFYIIENVPARVNDATGEAFFEPSILHNLQQLILSGEAPDRVIETSVYRYTD